MSASRHTREAASVAQVTRCWQQAVGCLHADPSLPRWQSVRNALRSFKGLPLDHLPRQLDRRIERTFCGVNAVLAHYSIKTWDDYRQLSDADLQQLETLIRGLI